MSSILSLRCQPNSQMAMSRGDDWECGTCESRWSRGEAAAMDQDINE